MRVFSAITLILFVLLLQSYCYGQDKSKLSFGKVGPDDFAPLNSPVIDSNTNGVILSESGSISFIGNKFGWFSYVYKYHIRARILNKKGIGLATARIRLYTENESEESAENISGTTWNLENGVVRESRLQRSEIFNDKADKHNLYKKFTLPDVREGSVIDYSWTITSTWLHNLPVWEFQSMEYPKFWSEFSVDIPQTLSYVFVRQGVHAFEIDKAGTGHASYRVTKAGEASSLGAGDKEYIVNANTVKHQWAMKDIPAFRAENYLSSPWNYLDKIELQLAKTYDGRDSYNQTNSWKKATEELLGSEEFGGALKQDNDWLNDKVYSITEKLTDPLEQAKAIYYYVSDHYTCTNHYDRYIRTSLKDVFKKNSGDVGEINLLLIAMLGKMSISADPVVLSTREYGYNMASYPMLERLNYVITRVKVGGKVYYLDPAHPQLGFGHLAGDCYNGHARIISNTDSGSVWFWADSLKEKKSTVVFLSSNGNGILEGNVQSVLGEQESFTTRERVNRSGKKEYFKQLQTVYGEDMEIGEGEIDSLNRREDPVKITYSIKMKQQPGAEMIYFNPLFIEAFHANPLKAAERKYPVEMPHTIDYVYILNMEIPEGYVVDELPKSAKVSYNGPDGSFEYITGKMENQIQLRCRLQLNKANFAPDDYPTLRDFYAFIVKKESESIVLKKKS